MVVDGGGKPVTRICEHGQWTFAGAGYSRQATKWRCPTGGCKPASRWIKADRAHPLIPPRDSPLHRSVPSPRRLEREFGSLKNEWALSPLRVRGPDRVRLHARPDDPRQAGLRGSPSPSCTARRLAAVNPPLRLGVLARVRDQRMKTITTMTMTATTTPILRAVMGRLRRVGTPAGAKGRSGSPDPTGFR